MLVFEATVNLGFEESVYAESFFLIIAKFVK